LKNDNVIFREDKDKLVQVHIVDGKAKITFDLKNAERYGPFPVHGQTGRVKDACVGYVQKWINGYGWDDDVKPTVVFLMEDGNLEYIEADPFWIRSGNNFMYWQLPWLDDVRSFETGEKSIFAIGGNGVRHDVKKLIDYRFLLDNAWICTFYPATEGRFIYGVIRFEQDGTVRYEEGEGDETIHSHHEVWRGRYRFVPEEEYAKIVVDLQIIWYREWEGYDRFGYPLSKRGEYRAIPISHRLVDLEMLNGDALHIHQETRRPFTLYEFQTFKDDGYPFWYMADRELIEHVLKNVAEAREALSQPEMKIIVTGGVSMLDGLARDVEIGHYLDGDFITKIRYTVIDNRAGQILKYDPEKDRWDRIQN
jgi:hypothetical protein